MQVTVSKVVKHMLSIAEMETVGIWATCVRFCLFDRHPRHTRWLTELIMDNAIPAKGRHFSKVRSRLNVVCNGSIEHD